MSCNQIIHDELKFLGDLMCSFWDPKLVDDKIVVKDEMRCDGKELINDNRTHVCRNCSVIDSYETTSEYIDFYENIFRIKKIIGES